MTVRVRFAPSPTGYLHIGGARTALYSYLYAKACGGEFILRIEDTDLERSKREFEVSQINDLKWLGINYQEGPDIGGDYGPYRQSERMDIYKKLAWQLIDQGDAYPCFLTSEELDELTKKAEEEKISPHAYHGKFRDFPLDQAKKKIEAGEAYSIRFKNPQKAYSFTDLVRGEVNFQEDMVGDFVILRSNGLPVYNFCCVVDDHLMKITHVIRAEEHLNNTVRQLMIYEALKASVPQFAHVSLLVGEDRQKLSKRHGATSVSQYREENYLPSAVVNYLLLLGWSHPEEKDIFDINELGKLFDLNRFSKSPALYDVKKMNYFNEQHLRALSSEALLSHIEPIVGSDARYALQTLEWKKNFAQLFKEKIQLSLEMKEKLEEVFSIEIAQDEPELKEALSWETTPQIHQYLHQHLAQIDDAASISVQQLDDWMNEIKTQLKIKGKPLFMGVRAVLTGVTHGPDLKVLISLMPAAVVKARMAKIAGLLSN